jgi:hypothetical protein
MVNLGRIWTTESSDGAERNPDRQNSFYQLVLPDGSFLVQDGRPNGRRAATPAQTIRKATGRSVGPSDSEREGASGTRRRKLPCSFNPLDAIVKLSNECGQ